MSTFPPIAVQSLNTVDLGRHGLIEASAGTGKTFTIEGLVIRILKEIPDLSIENILLVTYTEKAASELKARIRIKIKNELERPLSQSNTRVLQNALNDFDSASIQTIHGFCHALLNDFSFESGSLFQTELIDDRLLFEQALKKQMRSVWPDKYDRWLPALLAISGFNRQATTIEQKVITLARGGYRPEAGDRLYPDPNQTTAFSLIEDFKLAQKDLDTLMGSQSGFAQNYQQLNFNARSKKSLLNKIINPMVDWLGIQRSDHPDLLGFGEIYEAFFTNSNFKIKGPGAIVPEKYNACKDNSKRVCPNLMVVAAAFNRIVMTFEQLQQILIAETILNLQNEVENSKQIQGAITYDDMLTHVLSALTTPGTNSLLELLRNRFRFAFVDEFQDTDPIQWRIFKKIFIDDNSPCRLFLIGDPKQAIYGFRGADVITYLSARSFFNTLQREKKAQLYTLNINYRSTPPLVESYNHLFSKPSWFENSGQNAWNDISYAPVETPKGQPFAPAMDKEDSKRAAVNIIDLRGPKNALPALARLSRFMADEIVYLLSENRMDLAPEDQKEEKRTLDAGDIAILVRNRTNVELIETALTEKNIPYSYYRRPGLFDSDEAWYLSIILHAANSPDDTALVKKALLTPFFNWSPNDLLLFEELPLNHPSRELIFFWNELAGKRKWGAMFQSMMAETGLIYRQSATAGWDRMETNFNQIIAYLNEAAYRKNLDGTEMCAHLDALRRNTTSIGESGDIHEIETEQKKVQILTMHRSKGLEFPVVFIAGGLTRGLKQDYHQYHMIESDHPAKVNKVIDLTLRTAPSLHRREIEDEDKRLFYVALTRARFKLYLPFFPAPSKRAYFGPLCQFVAQSIKSAYLSPPEHIDVVWLKPDDHELSLKNLPGKKSIGESSPIKLNGFTNNWLPEEPSYTYRAIAVESYSSIHAKQNWDTPLPKRLSFDATVFRKTAFQKEDDERTELPAPMENSDNQTADEIPGGTGVGLMFHDILETIDFKTVVQTPQDLYAESAEATFIEHQLLLYQIDPIFRDAIVNVIINTLTTPIVSLSKTFCLGDLSPSDRIHEVPFYYSITSKKDSYIQGVVDLIFRYEGKYYLADWKSNRLANGYHQEAMAESMNAADYHLQYRLYTVAFLRWLKQSLGNQFHPKTHFGGVFYFFLRGMGKKKDEGIFYISPEMMGSLKTLETSIADRVTAIDMRIRS